MAKVAKKLFSPKGTLQAIDPTTANLMFSMAMPMVTADDKIRTLAAMNAPSPAEA